MATGQASEALQQICRAALLREGGGLTDGQLLADHIARRDATALAALVGRHAAMVWGVCRRVLGNDADAEDAFQATFLVLVRKAASLTAPELLANWLHGVAHMTALKARATGGKRRARERQVTDMPEPAVSQPSVWEDLQGVLDQELGRLGDKYRIAILLCDLEGKTRKEAARQLGVPEGTLAARLTRGREMLAKRLVRRGVAVSGAALGALLAQPAAAAQVPAPVLSAAIKAAGVYATGQAASSALISAKVAALTQGVLKMMLLQNLKKALALVLLVVCLAAGTTTVLVGAQAPQAPASGANKKDAAIFHAADTHGTDLERPPNKARNDRPKKEAPPARREEELLQGTWLAVAMELDGKAAPEDEVKSNRWMVVFKGGHLASYDQNGPRGSGVYRLDTSKEPKWMDVTLVATGSKEEVTERAIYKVEGDTLTLAEGRDNERPAGFTTTKEGPNRRVVVLKRQAASVELPSKRPENGPPKPGPPTLTKPATPNAQPSLSVESAHRHIFGKAGESQTWTLAGQGVKELTAYLVLYTEGKAERVSEVHCTWDGPSPPLWAQIAFLDQAGQVLGAAGKRHLSLSVDFRAGAPDKKSERLAGKLIDEPRGGRSSMNYDPALLAFDSRIVLHNDHLHMKPQPPLGPGEIRSETVGGGTSDAEMARSSGQGRTVVAVVLQWKK